MLLGTALGPAVLGIAVSVGGLLGGIALVDAALTALMAVDISLMPTRFVGYPLLLLCFLIGVLAGSSEVVSPMALSAMLSARRRSDVLLMQAGFGAALVVAITALFATHFARDAIPWHDVDLLWIGVAAMLLCATCSFALRAGSVELASGRARMRDTLRDGHSYLRSNRWMKSFLAIQLVFLAVTLSPMFYVIYAAESLGTGVGDLDDFLVFFGVGLLVGIPLWRLVRTRLGVRGMYAWSAGISLAAVVFCIVSQHWHLVPGLWALGPVLLLSALANQAVWPAAYDWIFGRASAEDAAVVISYTRIVVSVGVIFAAFASQRGGRVWPRRLAVRPSSGVDRPCLPGRDTSSAHRRDGLDGMGRLGPHHM